MAELLLELFSEEIPARMQPKACDDLKRLMEKALKDAQLEFDAMNAYATPRRLTLHITGLPSAQSDVREERRGPKADAPDKAIAGFLGSVGLTRDQLEEREDKKGTFLYAVIDKKGAPTADVLAKAIPQIIAAFPWPKSMRWGPASQTTESLRWVRPLQSILCVFNGAVVPFSIGGIDSADQTRGHRFHAPEAFVVTDFADYKAKLETARVLLDPLDRMKQIVKEANALTLIGKVQIVRDDALVAENAGLNEWPNVLMGSFDADFLDVPDEVLTATMRGNQKYFSLRDPNTKKLTNKFLCVSNLQASDGGRAIVAGNEKVLSARLSDAKFFWDQDQKTTMEEMASHLGAITFHAKLGSVGEKVERVAKLAKWLGEEYGIGEPKLNEEAAKLAKADLVSQMVQEFPDVQGVIGRYYADQQGKNPSVSLAIEEHYAPQGPGDTCPTEGVSVAVALADKIDTLVGFFAIDQKPTGSKDPFALRRAALGVIRLIVENGLKLKLSDLLENAFNQWFDTEIPFNLLDLSEGFDINDIEEWRGAIIAYDLIGSKRPKLGIYEWTELDYFSASKEDKYKYISYLKLPRPHGVSRIDDSWTANELCFIFHRFEIVLGWLLSFFADRLKVQQRELGVPHDLIDAVFALGGEDDLVRLLARVHALQSFLKTDDGANLLAGYKRAANILRIEEKKDKTSFDADVNAALMTDTAEKALLEALTAAQKQVSNAIEKEDFEGAMTALAQLRGPVDTFFDDVTVNAEDAAIRANRLCLLNGIRKTIHQVADFSKIEG